jgi:hypothetical protein
MNKSTAFLIISSLLIIGCKKDSTIDNGEETNFDYKSYLLKSQDSLILTFNFPVNSTTDQIYEVIDNYTQQDCFDVFRFNYQIEDYEIQSVALEYCNDIPPTYDPLILRVNISRNGRILLDNRITQFKEIGAQSSSFFSQSQRIKKHFFIYYEFDKSVNESQIKQYLLKIITTIRKFRFQKSLRIPYFGFAN